VDKASKSRIILTDKELKQVTGIVKKHINLKKYKAFIFGSRVIGNAQKYSDIDIGIKGHSPLPVITKFNLEDDFENSKLPYLVDVVDFFSVSKDFEKLAKSSMIQIE